MVTARLRLVPSHRDRLECLEVGQTLCPPADGGLVQTVRQVLRPADAVLPGERDSQKAMIPAELLDLLQDRGALILGRGRHPFAGDRDSLNQHLRAERHNVRLLPERRERLLQPAQRVQPRRKPLEGVRLGCVAVSNEGPGEVSEWLWQRLALSGISSAHDRPVPEEVQHACRVSSPFPHERGTDVPRLVRPCLVRHQGSEAVACERDEVGYTLPRVEFRTRNESDDLAHSASPSACRSEQSWTTRATAAMVRSWRP